MYNLKIIFNVFIFDYTFIIEKCYLIITMGHNKK